MEIWKEIKGYEGLYEVSSYGRIRSFCKNKTLLLYLNKSTNGYLLTVLFKDKKRKTHYVHKIVAIAFLNHIPSETKNVINHIDHNKENNRLDNLEIVSQRINSNHRKNKGSSQYDGVSYEKKLNKYRSNIFINGKGIYLGTFASEIEAAEAYKIALYNHENGIQITTQYKKTSSKHKGVSFNKREAKWISYIDRDGYRKFLGYFNTENEAIAAQTNNNLINK